MTHYHGMIGQIRQGILVADTGELHQVKFLPSSFLQYAHRKCIQRWCNEKGDTICEICLQVKIKCLLSQCIDKKSLKRISMCNFSHGGAYALSVSAAIQARLQFPAAVVSLWKYTNELQVLISHAFLMQTMMYVVKRLLC
jgi:hypothetical protein